MGGGVSFVPVHDADNVKSKLKALMGNKKHMDKLFRKIAAFGKASGHLNKSYDISQVELLDYFGPKNALHKDPDLQSFCPKPEVVNAAFKHVVGKGSKTSSGIDKKHFRILIPTIFLFSELWKVFEVCDNSIDDRKIFRGEFERAYNYFHHDKSVSQTQPATDDERVEGVHAEKITEETWDKEFDVIDKDKNGYITFDEFCSYVVKNIISPTDFIDAELPEGTLEKQESEIMDNEQFILNENGEIARVFVQDNEDVSAASASPAPTPPTAAVTDPTPSGTDTKTEAITPTSALNSENPKELQASALTTAPVVSPRPGKEETTKVSPRTHKDTSTTGG
mmetsp:Transcript_24682/g.24907  ORF Transcript_24682/g.24907 Transcript_24682/m.24907 type:complete len:337 (+) Transcript_24682:139-1149(+)|eukprot:CAMPEP_0182429150 /NCGR_PEP_ID=MMETSP1167-20130531/25549_1 /TAXON_ID=2988 /ORGANISM="Mallomonas Sp, Strain CCMP3275" /LENGTH=336 /DNA_ID=CAMNT_0024612501 /DNA_START=112 /DNA_END=1122 /DNA_ORIENTATION=+